MPVLGGALWMKDGPGPVLLCTISEDKNEEQTEEGSLPCQSHTLSFDGSRAPMATALVKHNN